MGGWVAGWADGWVGESMGGLVVMGQKLKTKAKAAMLFTSLLCPFILVKVCTGTIALS